MAPDHYTGDSGRYNAAARKSTRPAPEDGGTRGTRDEGERPQSQTRSLGRNGGSRNGRGDQQDTRPRTRGDGTNGREAGEEPAKPRGERTRQNPGNGGTNREENGVTHRGQRERGRIRIGLEPRGETRGARLANTRARDGPTPQTTRLRGRSGIGGLRGVDLRRPSTVAGGPRKDPGRVLRMRTRGAKRMLRPRANDG